jgi:hypothetical protein
VDNLVCPSCSTTYYSAALETMLARGERCDCGGLLAPLDRLGAVEGDSEVPAGVRPAPRGPGDAPPAGGRRFASR